MLQWLYAMLQLVFRQAFVCSCLQLPKNTCALLRANLVLGDVDGCLQQISVTAATIAVATAICRLLQIVLCLCIFFATLPVYY